MLVRKAKYRSAYEARVAAVLVRAGLKFSYETVKIAFTRPARESVYTPDFVLPNGILVETKGRLSYDDRYKHQLVKAQHPELDVRLVFANASNKIVPRSKTTYGEWATKQGITWAEGEIPKEWWNE
jgi:hypothetical protein